MEVLRVINSTQAFIMTCLSQLLLFCSPPDLNLGNWALGWGTAEGILKGHWQRDRELECVPTKSAIKLTSRSSGWGREGLDAAVHHWFHWPASVGLKATFWGTQTPSCSAIKLGSGRASGGWEIWHWEHPNSSAGWARLSNANTGAHWKWIAYEKFK